MAIGLVVSKTLNKLIFPPAEDYGIIYFTTLDPALRWCALNDFPRLFLLFQAEKVNLQFS